MKHLIVILSLTIWYSHAFALQTLYEFETLKQEQQYHRLTNELRCLVCQNQSIADSSASLAQNLREKIYELVISNQSDDAIKQFMSDRYGSFILYSPPITAATFLLWFLPVVLLAVTLCVFILRHRKSQSS